MAFSPRGTQPPWGGTGPVVTRPHSNIRSTSSLQVRESGVMPAQSGSQSGMSWNVPAPRRTTNTFAPVTIPAPPRARRRSKPHWGLRFVMLLFLLGGVTYFLRPSVPWIHARLTGVEAGVRSVAERYGLMTAPPTVLPTTPAAPATAPPPVATAPSQNK